MEAIIDDLLLLARIGSSPRADAAPVRLAEVAARVADARASAAARGSVTLEMSAAAPGTVIGDRSLLERLAANLVDNAIRYTPAGGRITIGVAEREGLAILTVKDNGIGIPAEALPRIFDRFFVVDPARSKEHGGTGLGLSIVKSVADRHGASIEVRSELGGGTEVEICFPLAAKTSLEPPVT
jgi:signal transduction histidine kinase